MHSLTGKTVKTPLSLETGRAPLGYLISNFATPDFKAFCLKFNKKYSHFAADDHTPNTSIFAGIWMEAMQEAECLLQSCSNKVTLTF